MNPLNEVTRNQAMRALTASSEELAGVQIVRGTITGLPFPWRLEAAIAMVRSGNGVTSIVWDPAGPGLALLDENDDVVYRFATINPFEMPEPGPEPTTQRGRAALRVVRPAS